MARTVTITFETEQAPWRSEMDLGESGIKSEIVLKLAGKTVGKLVSWYGKHPYGLFLETEKGEFAQRIEIENEKDVLIMNQPEA